MPKSYYLLPLLVAILILTFIYTRTSYTFLSFKDTSTLRLFVIGDFGELHPKWDFPVLPVKKVADSMEKVSSLNPVSMIVTVGDNFYSTDIRQFFQSIQKVFSEIFIGSHLKKVDWYLAYGNHDYYYSRNYGELLEEFYENVHMPSGAWNLTLPMKDFIVDFTFLPCDLICHGNLTNNNTARQCRFMHSKTGHSQVFQWLESHLQDMQDLNETIWKIIVIHYPVFSFSVTGMDSENLKFYLLPILRKFQVDLVLSGHNHNMQYFFSDPLKFSQFKKQDIVQKCLRETDIICNGKKVHCYFRNVSCADNMRSCIHKIPVDEIHENNSGFTTSHVFKKGQGLHQVIQGAGGADLNPICPGITSPMADYLFGMAAHGFSELVVTRESLRIKYILTDTSTAFESTIVV